ncbi:hypothetical protein ASPVEDRAFT_150703 [Aspergillus versicolor CBS 583.65]|uniref:Peptidase M61 catalytic domain-containing protein n=1 Tax=Aspergillus versicolor CBS 583.65 TaxID=1036611 RepID=A0A1L9PKA2_ASPVE|nr:uncharacterized protein ASPVEDRAFT_150703 [Aspergillus versicolor CBS 583.65]OJJ01960.1 hypothetical protein ASPVEDRAFT_150703 [Aspergillus versicolor CBS 583.65]
MRSALLLVTLAFSAAASYHSIDQSRVVNITLAPVVTHGIITGVSGQYTINYATKANETLVDIPLSLAGKPTARYDTKTLTATDGKGSLRLLTSEATDADGQPTRYFRTTRATQGPVTVRFTAKPNTDFPAHIGPLFDLRQQGENNGGGIVGANWAWLPGVASTTLDYQFSLRWDLEDAPGGTTVAWTWGEDTGPFYRSGTRDDILYTYFAVGRLSRFPAPGAPPTNSRNEFGMYWMDQPSFNTTDLGNFVNDFFNVSTTFWRDHTDQPYRVFVRRNGPPEYGSGGTALTRSFSFGWNPTNVTEQTSLRLLIAHEMTHNWAVMPGASALISRWAEGMAEFYSLRLLWRAHLLSTSRYVQGMNNRLASYYANTYINATDFEAYEHAWDSRDAQTIPYGRGLIELANIDAAMRNQSHGTLGLDDLTHHMRQLCEDSPSACTPARWVNVTADYLGASAVTEYNRITSGSSLLVPVNGSLGPCFDVVKTRTSPETWAWKAKQGIDTSSEACTI